MQLAYAAVWTVRCGLCAVRLTIWPRFARQHRALWQRLARLRRSKPRPHHRLARAGARHDRYLIQVPVNMNGRGFADKAISKATRSVTGVTSERFAVALSFVVAVSWYGPRIASVPEGTPGAALVSRKRWASHTPAWPAASPATLNSGEAACRRLTRGYRQ